MISLSLNILDVVQNSVRAKSSEIIISVRELISKDLFEIIITDNGSGIPENILPCVADPFVTTRTTRKTGLGLPLLKHHANLTGGGLEVSSEVGGGTVVKATFSLSHIDRQPLGDIAGVITMLIACNPKICFIYSHKTDKGEYRFSSEETKDYLEVETLNDNALLGDIKEMIRSNLADIGASD